MFDFLKRKNKIDKPSGSGSVDNWSNVVSKGFKEYNSLTVSERIWFNTRMIIDSTNNGGLISYYYNSGAENVYDAIEDLKFLGFENVAELIQRYNEILFKGGTVPKGINERNKFVNEIDEQMDDSLQNIEIDLTKVIDGLENQLGKFLKNEKLID